jgi:hypothetical protein
MKNSKSINWVAGAVVVAMAAWLSLFLFPTPPTIDARPHQGLGEVMAGEALKLAEGGARIIVITRDKGSFKLPATEAQMAGCLAALKSAGKTPAAIRTIKVDPLRVVGVPPGEFFEILRQGKENDVIISFLGPPALDAGQMARLGPKRSRIVALCAGTMPARVDLKRLFEQQLLHTAIVSKPDAPAQAAAGNAPSAFEQMFKVITPGTVAELSALTATARAD